MQIKSLSEKELPDPDIYIDTHRIFLEMEVLMSTDYLHFFLL